jgi:predicted aconitase with swiveling domain
LLVSGPVLADIWFNKGIPIVEYPEKDIYDRISDDDWVEVNGKTGEIEIRS